MKFLVCRFYSMKVGDQKSCANEEDFIDLGAGPGPNEASPDAGNHLKNDLILAVSSMENALLKPVIPGIRRPESNTYRAFRGSKLRGHHSLLLSQIIILKPPKHSAFRPLLALDSGRGECLE